MGAIETQLIPISELTPGAVGAIRNQVINGLVARASQELSMALEKLVVRDVRPFSDLSMYAAGTTIATIDEWLYDATSTTANAFTSVTGDATMGDQRYVAIFGVRDLRKGVGVHTTAMQLDNSTDGFGASTLKAWNPPPAVVRQLRLSVGGAVKVIWDLSSVESYPDPIGFSPSAIVIPQNTTFNISYNLGGNVAGRRAWLQLIGVVVEPRGRVTSP